MTNPFAPDKSPEDTRIVVAMSGGVDSSTVAAMMVEQGYEVIGITLQLYDYGKALQKKGACCAGQDIEDARNVCETLNIPHYILNYESLFKESVIDDFVDSYTRGETPIPCIRCNQTVKFRDLFKVAQDLDADALVTGHYVQRKENGKGVELHCGLDSNKDQSYFLFATSQDQLNYLHFPLGGMSKEETRKEAERFGLQVADKPDSQDICFVPQGNYRSVVTKFHPGALDEGRFVYVDGTVMGKHDGIINYTVGQRRGMGIAHSEPLYVIKINPETNDITIGPESALYNNIFYINDINWLGGDIPKEGLKTTVKIRSTQTPVDATLYIEDNGYKIVLDKPEKAITPGQACVIYDGSQVLGGGWIIRYD